MPTCGFVTIASGNEKYYRLAVRLLRSYRKHASDETPFAIICDRENEYTREFDDVVLMDSASGSYMDKLMLYRYAPYDETIFIDADSLILADPGGIWKDFSDADDVSCYGCVYPLDSDRAWFTHEGCGKYRDSVRFLIDLHGGIYYLRKGERCESIFQKAIELAGEYSLYGFKNFEKPADEPVLAMSLAIHQSQPCDKPMRVLFVPSYWGRLKTNPAGELLIDGKKRNVEILHFGTANTERFVYRYMADNLNKDVSRGGTYSVLRYWKVKLQTAPIECKTVARHGAGQLLRKLLPGAVVNRLKEKI